MVWVFRWWPSRCRRSRIRQRLPEHPPYASNFVKQKHFKCFFASQNNILSNLVFNLRSYYHKGYALTETGCCGAIQAFNESHRGLIVGTPTTANALKVTN